MSDSFDSKLIEQSKEQHASNGLETAKVGPQVNK
jgi:hypothetical protein